MKKGLHVMLIALMFAVWARAQTVVGRFEPSDLLAGFTNGERWLTFPGDCSSQRHSPLSQITPANVGSLKEQWMFGSALPVAGRGTEATPLFFGGRLYVTGQAGHAWALDAR